MSVERKKEKADWRSFCDMQSAALQPALGDSRGRNQARVPRKSKGWALPALPPFLGSAGLADLGTEWNVA